MKRNYLAPFAKILLCGEDVITSSVTTLGDDNVAFWPGEEKEEQTWN